MIRLSAQIPVRLAGYKWYPTDDGLFRLGPADEDKGYPEFALDVTQWGDLMETSGLYRVYDPFQTEPALFRLLADCDADPPTTSPCDDPESWEPVRKTILEFSNEWGLLSGDGPYERVFVSVVGRLRDALLLWEAVRDDDQDRMQQFVAYSRRSNRWRRVIHYMAEPMLTPESWYGPYRKADLPERARELLHLVMRVQVNKDLQVLPRRIAHNGWEMCLVVPDLNSAIWMQFAQAVVDHKAYRRCDLCGRPFEVAPDVNRKSRKFCSDTCRVKHYQRRQAKARRMRADGQGLRQIAKELDTNPKTVKRWLGEK